MNSYNENLQNTVAATLQSQNLELQSLQSQYTAAMYTLYYAEGATIPAEEKLNTATIYMDNKKKIKEQAVKNMSISSNQLNSSTQANTYNGQGVTNMATCASNVQIAANGITRLAADVGSIFSIVNAADFGTDIYTLTDQVKNLVNVTAYNAELASKTAMEASAYTAQVSASTVLSDAKATNGLMSNILQVASNDYNNAAQTVAADNATLATVNTTEKLAEGAFESATIDLSTGQSAYYSVNLGLNLNLTAIPLAADSFLVTFDRIKAPFPPPNVTPVTPPPPGVNPALPNGEEWYPVSEYYVFVAKQSKQLTFSISEAENLRTNNPHAYVKIAEPILSPASEGVIKETGTITRIINYNAVEAKDRLYVLSDTDGDVIAPGDNYVVFVMAVYLDKYKRLINNFDDYLSAPSLYFCMTTQLNAATNINVLDLSALTAELAPKPGVEADDATTMGLAKLKDADKGITKVIEDALKTLEDADYLVTFETDATGGVKINCNCIYLPYNIKVPEKLLTQPGLEVFTTTQVKIDQIQIQNQQQILQEYVGELQNLLVKGKSTKPKGDVSTDKAADTASAKVQANIDLVNKKIKKLASNTQPKFFFNVNLAEIVPAGSYTPATQIVLPTVDGKGTIPTNWWYAPINAATTDNFGNLLSTSDTQYATAILTLTNSDDPAVIAAYTNSISDFDTVTLFPTEPIKPKK